MKKPWYLDLKRVISRLLLIVILITLSACKFSTDKNSQPTQANSALLIQTPNSIITTQAVISEQKIQTVFVIVMENKNWSKILKNPSAPYLNNTLLPQSSYAEKYYSPIKADSSLPHYLWLEAGKDFGITEDGNPEEYHQNTDNHLVTYLDKSGISWKSYQEGISGDNCPISNSNLYAARHNPMVYFDDVTGKNNPNSEYCIDHVRPYEEFKNDLKNNTVARYNFLTPDLCHDMHNDKGCDTSDPLKNGDNWLSKQIPVILDSDAYKKGGVVFITWDEPEESGHRIGLIVLSPYAKGEGYSNTISYTHSSLLRTIQEIFDVKPFLGDAAKAEDLSDLFKTFP